MLRRIAFGFCLLAACAGPARSPSGPDDASDAEPLTPDTSAIGLRRSVVADQYFWLRAKALEGEAPAPFADALAAILELRRELAGDEGAWEDLEVPLGSVRRASELGAAWAELPLTREIGGKGVPLRARALRLARAIEASEPAYRAGPFREHDAEIMRAAGELRARLVPNVDAILRALAADLSLPGPTRPIVVTLVGDAPYPGVFAADGRGIATASFVRVHGLDGGALAETVLHEVIHAIDELTVRLPTATNALRKALAERGVDSDTTIEMAIATVTLAEAASLVRRFVDPSHRAMGERGFYTLFPPAPAIVEAWTRHVDGAPLDTTADAIAKAVLGS